MSIPFSDTSTLKGLVQAFEREIGATQGDVSGNTTRLKEFTADVNMTMDDFFSLAIQAGGTWQTDDSNQSDYPIISTNIVSGQRDYSFTTDGSGNLVLDIYKVLVATSAGVFQEMRPIDAQSDPEAIGFTNGLNITGAPYLYDKTANGIFLDPIPNYNYSGGLKVYINREPVYFTSTDTSKKPGVPGLFHDYFYLKPAQMYAARKGLAIAGGRLRNGAFTGLLMTVNDLEKEITEYYTNRERDVRKQATMAPIPGGFR